MSVITLEIDSALLVGIIVYIIGSAVYIAILEYRFRRVENHPFIRGLRELQDEQLFDLARRLMRGDGNNAN